jgi:hypothetical protein
MHCKCHCSPGEGPLMKVRHPHLIYTYISPYVTYIGKDLLVKSPMICFCPQELFSEMDIYAHLLVCSPF